MYKSLANEAAVQGLIKQSTNHPGLQLPGDLITYSLPLPLQLCCTCLLPKQSLILYYFFHCAVFFVTLHSRHAFLGIPIWRSLVVLSPPPPFHTWARGSTDPALPLTYSINGFFATQWPRSYQIRRGCLPFPVELPTDSTSSGRV